MEIKLQFINGDKDDLIANEPIWIGRWFYPKHRVVTTKALYNAPSIFNSFEFLFDSFGSTYICNFVARQSDYTEEEFVQKIMSISLPIFESLLADDENKRIKYPIDELYYLRYSLWSADDAGEHRHPSEVIKELGGKELRFEGCPIADCDFILAQFNEPPLLPKYIEDFSTDKEEKDRIKEEFPEFILED